MYMYATLLCNVIMLSGPPSAPTDLNITTYNDTASKLAWGPPPDAQSPSLLSYAVVISNGSGAPVYNETVREPQLFITTPDPCGHYEATVTPMCGSIAGAQTSSVKLGGEGNIQSYTLGIHANLMINILGFPDPPTSISHDQVHTSLVYPLSPSDNVTVKISLPVSGI